MAAITIIAIIELLDKIIGLIAQAKDEIEKVRKQNEEIHAKALKALADGDFASLNTIISELIEL